MPRRLRAGALAASLVLLSACAAVTQIKMKLPVRPRLPLKGNEHVAIAPFLIVTAADKPKDQADISKVDLQAEFRRFLRKSLDRKTKLQVIELDPKAPLPSRSLVEISRATEYWRGVGAKSGADIVVSGSIDFRVQDQAGYKTEEYVSPINGQTYFRQIYIEQTGFLFDLVVLVFDGRTGEKILQDEFKDFRERNNRRVDELSGLFQNLFSIEEQLLNLFVPRERTVERYLFTR